MYEIRGSNSFKNQGPPSPSRKYLRSSRLLSKNLKVRIFRTGTSHVFLYGRGTWSLTQKEEHRLKVVGKRVLRKIFGPKRDKIIGGLRKLHNEELHNLYYSPIKIRTMESRRMKWAEHVAYMGRRGMHIRLLRKSLK
jgi:hypothetical protein